ncbi:hypothetical protein AWC38_SpisGene12113 [Stylophora pistillata]|uniref:F-box/LRR-repeat protein 8 n=1 Tax=Stylophora pistillata TaxID=50429 RepID=A0A2B4S2T9_STYPI|nr:hypothetical protein AWC38_SpisGene12113 [Stylophora pistillata]
MESSHQSVENPEVQLETTTDSHETHTQENYRHEIEDIVRGFIIEKDILAQSHEEEIRRMKNSFDLERRQLLHQLEMDKDQMMEASRITESVANGVAFAASDTVSHDTGQIRLFSGAESLAGAQRLGSFQPVSSGGHDIYEVDSNLIREIAEVYLRINNGPLTSQIHPELDLEDKYERERESIERNFQLEKRELKRKLEEEYQRQLQQEKMKYEATIAEMKTTISELHWQKREAENYLRHEKERWEMNSERDKNEIEKKYLQMLQDTRRKMDEKHCSDLEKQREKYEENISDLQTDISKLTLQLKELNDNLSQEKEIIMTKFEREIKEMEQAFLEQRSSLKANFEAEFMMRLENETSLLKNINVKLKEDLEFMEKERKDMEKKGKEERRKLEERFEEEISEIEQRYSEEKRALKLKLEERYQLGLVREKGGLEETIQEMSEEITLLKQENAQMEITYAERREELRRQLEMEREDMRRKINIETEEVRIRIENELSQKLMLEKSSQGDIFQQNERRAMLLKANCDHLEQQMSALTQERDMLIRDRARLEENLRSKEVRLTDMNDGRISNAEGWDAGSAKLKEIIREKDNELAAVKYENQKHELSLSAMRRETNDLQDEIASLKRRLPNSTELFDAKFGSNESGKASLEESLRRKEGEVSSLQRDKYDLESRLSSIQRKNEELEDEIATLRRKKLDVEDEISALKRDKAESDNQLASLKRDKADLEDLLTNLKRKQGEVEDTMSMIKREKAELEHEISILKRNNSTMEIEVHRQFSDEQEKSRTVHRDRDHVTQDKIMPSATREISFQSHDSFNSNNDDRGSDLNGDAGKLQKKVSDLLRQQNDLESAIGRLSQEKSDLEKDLKVKLEYRRSVLHQPNESSLQEDTKENSWVLHRQKDDLERMISSLKKEQDKLESEVSQYQIEASSLEGRLNELKDDKAKMELEIKALNHERQNIQKTIDVIKKDKREVDGRRKVPSGIPRSKTDRAQEGNNIDQKITDLQQERDDLKMQLVQLQSETVTNNLYFSKEAIRTDEKEVSELTKIRKELEKEITLSKRNKAEVEAGIIVVQEAARQGENDVNNLRKEKKDLELQVTALESQITRLRAECSVMKDERDKNESEVDRLRREKAELERDVFTLQSQQQQLETNISVGDDAWRRKTIATNGLQTNVQDITTNLETLVRRKKDLQSEIVKIKATRDQEERETQQLRREKSEIEFQLSVLRTEPNAQDQEHGPTHGTYTKEGYLGSKANDVLTTQEELKDWLKQKQDLRSEISKIQTLKTNEEDDLLKLRQQKSDMEMYIYDVEIKKQGLEMDGLYSRCERQELRNAPDRTEVEVAITSDRQPDNHRFSTDHDVKSEVENSQNYHTSQQQVSHQRTQFSSSDSYQMTSNNSSTSINNSYFHINHPQRGLPSETLSTNPNSSTLHEDSIKEDNTVVSLRRERNELESQLYDMRIQLTRLQAEVTSLENRRTVLETVHRGYATADLDVKLINVHTVEVDTDLCRNTTRSTTEDEKDTLIQEYQDQIRQLQQQKLELEQKVGLLEWQLENMKQKVELQEIAHRREISTLSEKSQSFHGFQGDRQDDTLQVFYQRLSYFLMTGEHSSKEIMEEIERQISNLKEKAEFDHKNTKEFVTPVSVKLDKERYSSKIDGTIAQDYAIQLKAQEFKYTKCLENHGHYLRTVEIHCKQEDKINRESACTLILMLSGMKERRLERFTVKFLGENPLFYAGQEFIECLRVLFDKPSEDVKVLSTLKSVDLSKLPIAYSDNLINCLVENNRDLESLNIQNAALVCKVTSGCIENVLKRCRKIKSLALHHTSVTEEILLSLTEENRAPLSHLSIDCRREEKFGKDITSETWEVVRRKIPNLRVTLAFDTSCPMYKVDMILKPEVPVKNLRLEVMSEVIDQVYFAAMNYSKTLENLSISTTSSEELEKALLYLVTRCERLKELFVFQCYISQDTKQKILELRPQLQKYYIKSKQQPTN